MPAYTAGFTTLILFNNNITATEGQAEHHSSTYNCQVCQLGPGAVGWLIRASTSDRISVCSGWNALLQTKQSGCCKLDDAEALLGEQQNLLEGSRGAADRTMPQSFFLNLRRDSGHTYCMLLP